MPNGEISAEQKIEERLRELGLYWGPVDGQWRADAQFAFQRWKRANGFLDTPHITPATLLAVIPEATMTGGGSVWFAGLDDDDRTQLSWLEQLMEAPDLEAADAIVIEWLLRQGPRAAMFAGWMLEQAPAENRVAMQELVDRVEDVMRRWVAGERMTARADEDARRAALGRIIVEEELASPGKDSLRPLLRLAARSMLSLPPDHPFRDVETARAALHRAQEVFADGEHADPEAARLTREELEKLEPAQPVQPAPADDEPATDAALDELANQLPKADAFTRATVQVKLGEEWFGRGQIDKAVPLLEAALEFFREQAVVGASYGRREEVYTNLGRAYATLACARIRLGDSAAAFAVLEAHRAFEVRQRARVRAKEGGAKALEITDRVRALGFGFTAPDAREFAPEPEDPLGREIPSYDRGREFLRRALVEIGADVVPTTRPEDLALDDGEVALFLTSTFAGTCGLLVRPGGAVEPIDWPDITTGYLLMYEKTGALRAWPGGLIAVEGFAFDEAVPPFVEEVAADIDARLRELLGDARRVYYLPDALWWAVPLWAMPALRGIEVLQCIESGTIGAPRRPARGDALVVGNPTEDLPLAELEADAGARALWDAVEVLHLARADATRDRALARMARSGIVHFAGHGIEQLNEALDSALQCALGESDDPDECPDRNLLALAVPPHERWKEIDGDELRFRLLDRWPVELRITPDGTRAHGLIRLAANRCVRIESDGKFVYLSELLTAGSLCHPDVDLGDCGVVFLSACTCGAPRFSDGFSASGIVAALLEAGVQSVVSSMWPVDDAFGCLYADLFFRRLAPRIEAGEVQLAAIVNQISNELRAMTRDDAVERVGRIREMAQDPKQQAALDAYLEDLAKREGAPFENPYEWAAFFVSGAPTIRFGA